MDQYTVQYLNYGLFEGGEKEIHPSDQFNEVDLDWNDPATMDQERTYEPNEGWFWDGAENTEGITWGGCLESIDELLRHGIQIPSLEDFENIVLMTETSEEIPSNVKYPLFRNDFRQVFSRAAGQILPAAFSMQCVFSSDCSTRWFWQSHTGRGGYYRSGGSV